MLRKIVSVLFLSVGGFFLMGPLMESFLILEGGDVASIFLLYAAIGIALIVGGLALWGWGRWRIVLGVVFTVVGSMLGLVGITFPLVMLSPEWKLLGGPSNSDVMKPIIGSSALFGVVLLAIGIPLIIKQKRRDRGVSI